MSTLEIDGKKANNPRYIPLASDDGVWLYETREAQDLVELVSDPFNWVRKIKVLPNTGGELRAPILLDNYVITVDVATTVISNPDKAAAYVIDGIDSTGYISAKMMTVGGRFQFESGLPWDKIRAKILDGTHEFVIATAGERAFVHLHLGEDPQLRAALLCAAIENQDWLCDLFDDLELHMLDEAGNKCGKADIKFHMPAAKWGRKRLNNSPHITIVVQGGRNPQTVVEMADIHAMNTTAPGGGGNLVDACNANSGYLVQNQFYMDTFVIKAYEPSPAPGP